MRITNDVKQLKLALFVFMILFLAAIIRITFDDMTIKRLKQDAAECHAIKTNHAVEVIP